MGRGTLYIMVSTALVFLSGYIVNIGLGRYLGPDEYGTFGVVFALMTTITLFFTYGLPVTASKFISEGNVKAGNIIKAATRMQFVFSTVVFFLYLGLSNTIARLLNDMTLVPYIRLSALAIPAYALSSLYLGGYLNGMRRFGMQSLVSIVNSLAKIALVFIFVFVGWGVNGAISGYIGAAAFSLVLAWKFARPSDKGEDAFGWRQLLAFGVPSTIFVVLFFLLISIDLYAVKALDSVQSAVGYYTASSTISKLAYFLFSGLAITLLPSISRSISFGAVEQTRSYIRDSIRYMILALIPVTLLISATSSELTTLIYSNTYINASDSLEILVCGLAMLSVFYVLSNIMIGGGKPKITVWITLPLVALDIILNIVLIPRYGLTGAAWATTATGFVGMCAAAVYVYWKFKTLVNAMSALKIVLASVVIYLIALNVSVPPAWLIPLYIGLAILYGGLLWIGREIKREDIELVKKVVKIGKASR